MHLPHGLDHDTNDDEYQTSRFHRSRILNYHGSIIKKKQILRSIFFFKEGKVTDNNFYTYDIKDIHMIKAVAAELSEIGLTQKKELSICLAIDYMASTNIASSFDYSTKFSRIVNPMRAN